MKFKEKRSSMEEQYRINQLSVQSRKEMSAAYLFLCPSILLFLIFIVGPFGYSFYYSLTKFDGIGLAEFIGLKNYIKLFRDEQFLNAVKNTFLFALYVVPTGTVLGLLIATLLKYVSKPWQSNFYRGVIFLPYILSLVSAALTWSWLYNTDYGIFNVLLDKLRIPPVPWLTSPKVAMISVSLMSLWKGLGFQVVIFLAGLQGISQSYYEAAEIDGASRIQQFFQITIPLLKDTTIFILIMGVIGALQVFDQVFILTGGGPVDSTDVIANRIYLNAFTFFKQGYASAMSWVLFVLVFSITLLNFQLQERSQTNG